MIYTILLGLFFTFVIASAIKTIVDEEAKKTRRRK